MASSFEDELERWSAMTPAQRERMLRGEYDPPARGSDRLKLRNGGLVRGPGTGTSDSIKAEVPEGSYIMPADSTAKLTPEMLAMLIGARSTNPNETARGKPKDIPVNLSNGEYQIPPEQVRNVGAKVLDTIKDATHVPAAAQRAVDIGASLSPRSAMLLPAEWHHRQAAGAQSFADGGRVESTDEMIARIQAKYGTGSRLTANPQPAPVERPAASPQGPAPTIAGAASALRNRRQQLDEAAGYADGGTVQSRGAILLHGVDFSRAPAGGVMKNGRLSFDDGGDVQDPDQPRKVPGAPGVVRVGNEYSAAPEPVGQASPTGGASFDSAMTRTPKPPQPAQPGVRTVPGAPGVQREGNSYSAAPSAPSSASRVPTGDEVDQWIATPAEERERLLRGEPPSLRTDVSFSDVTTRSPKPPSPVRFEEPRVPDAVVKRFEELQKPGMTLRVQGKELAEPGKVMASVEPKTGTPAATQNAQATTTTLPEADFSRLSQQQRNTAGDEYRNAWQRQAPGGLRSADDTTTALYNAEQLIRGTGITAQRDANGRMAFSGDGTNALPQNYTSGFDLNLANQRMARANAIRGETVALQQRMADDANFASGVTGARKTTPEERRELAEIQTDRDRRSATYSQNRLQEEFARARFAGDGRAMENIATQMAMTGKQQSDIREDVRKREAGADEAEYRRNQLLYDDADSLRRDEIERRRLALMGPKAESETLANDSARLIQGLQFRIANPKSDEDAREAMKALQMLQGGGRDSRSADTALAQERMKTVAELFKAYSERMPLGPDDKTPIPFEQWAAPALKMIGGQAGGGTEGVRTLPQGMAPADVRAAAQRQIANGVDRRLVEARLSEYGLSLGEG